MAELLPIISLCFEEVSKDTVLNCVNHFLWPVKIKDMNREDIKLTLVLKTKPFWF